MEGWFGSRRKKEGRQKKYITETGNSLKFLPDRFQMRMSPTAAAAATAVVTTDIKLRINVNDRGENN